MRRSGGSPVTGRRRGGSVQRLIAAIVSGLRGRAVALGNQSLLPSVDFVFQPKIAAANLDRLGESALLGALDRRVTIARDATCLQIGTRKKRHSANLL